MKTREQLRAEISCICGRLQRLIPDVKYYYGNKQALTMAFIEGAVSYLQAMLNSIK